METQTKIENRRIETTIPRGRRRRGKNTTARESSVDDVVDVGGMETETEM